MNISFEHYDDRDKISNSFKFDLLAVYANHYDRLHGMSKPEDIEAVRCLGLLLDVFGIKH